MCRLCGNGLREEGESCDDHGNSNGCSSDCSAVSPGWACAGGTDTVSDVCSAGPGTPIAPIVSETSETSITWTWSLPDTRGLPLTSYLIQYDSHEYLSGIGESSARQEQTVTTNSFVLSNLRRLESVSVPIEFQYAARIRACTAVGCSLFSDLSAPASVRPVLAYAQQAGLADNIYSSSPQALVGDLDLEITGLEVAVPTAPAQSGPTNTPQLSNGPSMGSNQTAAATPAPTTSSSSSTTTSTTGAAADAEPQLSSKTDHDPAAQVGHGVAISDGNTPILLLPLDGSNRYSVSVAADAFPPHTSLSLQKLEDTSAVMDSLPVESALKSEMIIFSFNQTASGSLDLSIKVRL